jgi:3-deoxy-D-manno-octulosonic acid kinase
VSGAPLPAGYRAVVIDGVEAFAREGAEGWLASVLAGGNTLHGWAERRAIESLSGRGPVHVIAARAAEPGGSARWAVRHYRRGGAMARLLGDRYRRIGPSRPVREVGASQDARARGVRTPAVVAGAAYDFGGPWAGLYRADLVTELVTGAASLARLVAERTAPLTDPLRGSGRLVRALARAGVRHPDLSAGNVLIDALGQAWIVDLDRARTETPTGVREGRAMLARLERSVRKVASAGTRLSREEWTALRAGFEEGP